MTTKSLFEKITVLSANLPPLNKSVFFAASAGGIGSKTVWHRGNITNIFANGDVSIYYPATDSHVVIRLASLAKTAWRYNDSRTPMQLASDAFLESKGIVPENATELMVARMMFEGGVIMARQPSENTGCGSEEHC